MYINRGEQSLNALSINSYNSNRKKDSANYPSGIAEAHIGSKNAHSFTHSFIDGQTIIHKQKKTLSWQIVRYAPVLNDIFDNSLSLIIPSLLSNKSDCSHHFVFTTCRCTLVNLHNTEVNLA